MTGERRIRSGLTKILGAALVLCLAPATASAAWVRLTTPHFVLVGDAAERQMRDIAQRLEQFRDVVGRVFSDDTTHSPVPAVVVVFQND